MARMTAQDIAKAQQYYLQLRRQGVSGQQAHQMAFPQGAPEQISEKELAEKQQKAGLAGTGGMIAGALATKGVADAVAGKPVLGGVFDKIGSSFSTGSNVANTAGQTVSNVSSSLASSGAPTAVGSAANGGTLMSNGSVVGGESAGLGTAGTVLSAAAAAKGTYDTIKGFQQGGEGLRSGMTTAGAGIGSLIGGPVGGAIGAAAGNTLGYGFQGSGWKNNLALAGMTGGLSMIPGVGNGIRGLIHKTTRQSSQENTQNLLKTDPENKAWQNYITGMRGQYNAPAPDKSKPFAGKYATFEDYKKGGLEAGDLTGVYGNLKTFGADYGTRSFDQQKAITQKLIDAGLYDSKKGEVIITDEAKAKQIYDQTIKNLGTNPAQIGKFQGSNINTANIGVKPAMVSGNQLVQALSRSRTSSPGIDKNGRRITY